MKNKEKKKISDSGDEKGKEFKGYSIEELRYQLALLTIKKEFLREKAMESTSEIKKQIPGINGKSPLSGITPSGIVGKIVRGLNFTDYLLLGLQAVMIGKKVGSLFRRGKK